MKYQIHACSILVIIVALAGTAAADITVESFDRANWALIAHCDSALVLVDELEWGLSYGEFSSEVSVSLGHTVSATQQSTVTLDGDELQIIGSGSSRIIRTESGACESAQADSWISLRFTTSENSTLLIDNHGFVSSGDYSRPWFSVVDFASGEPVFFQQTVDHVGSIPLEAGVVYSLRLNVLSQAEGDGPVDESAAFEFDLAVVPQTVAVEVSSLSSVKGLFR